MRLRLFLIAGALLSSPTFAQDEIMVSDAACTERKLAACLMETTFEQRGWPAGPEAVKCPTGSSETTSRMVQLNKVLTCKITDPKTVLSKPTFSADYPRCKLLVDNFPSHYGENCLKPRTDGRQLATWNAIRIELTKRLCSLPGSDEQCQELNQIPE